jgi:LysM repeat protein
MHHPIRLVVLAMLVITVTLVAACAPQATQEPAPTPTRQGTLVPFHSATPSSTPSPVDQTTPTPLPSPTPTMRSHTIQRGQDLGGIAFSYRVSLQALLEANPDVDPYFLVVGSNLNIPPSLEPAEQTPVPTPVAVEISPVLCSIGREGGAWCFTLVTNPQDYDVESVSAIIRIADENAGEVISQVAFGPLDLLPAGGSMPLAAYFPPRLPKAPLQASAELLTSLPVFPGSERYLSVQIENLDVNISEDGLSGEVRGEIIPGEAGQEDSLVRMVLIGYDSQGNIAGLRRWENENPLRAGRRHPFTIWVYSTGAEIEQVEVFAEARLDQR